MITDKTYFNCYSRKLMHFLGFHGINYVDKFYNPTNGRPYWQFERNDQLAQLLNSWENYKATGKLN